MKRFILPRNDFEKRAEAGEYPPRYADSVTATYSDTLSSQLITWDDRTLQFNMRGYPLWRFRGKAGRKLHAARENYRNYLTGYTDEGLYRDTLLDGDVLWQLQYVYNAYHNSQFMPYILRRNLRTGDIQEYMLPWRLLNTETSTEYNWVGLTFNGVWRFLGNVDKWILVVAKCTQRWEILAVSKKDPTMVKLARDLPELAWLVRDVTKYSYMYGVDSDVANLERVDAFNTGTLSTYVYLGVRTGSYSNAFGRATSTLLFIDFVRQTAYAVSAPPVWNIDKMLVDTDGVLYYAGIWMFGKIDPFTRTHQAIPLNSQYMELNVNSRSLQLGAIWPCSPWEIMFTSRYKIGGGTDSYDTHVYVIDAFEDKIRELTVLLNTDTISGRYVNSIRCDNLGNFFLMYDQNGGTTNSTGNGAIWIGQFKGAGVYPKATDAGEKNFGNPLFRWNELYANTLWDEVAPKRLFTLMDIRDESALDPTAISTEDNGSYLEISGSRWRKTKALQTTPISAPGEERGVFGVTTQSYGTLPEPSPLPDWFNGCTPVVDKGKWRAGDALFYLHQVSPEANNVVFVSKDKRWDARVLPFTCLYDTLPQAFTSLSPEVPIWYIIAAADFSNQANDVVQLVDGFAPGMIWPLPTEAIYNRGINRAELGVTGNFTNKYWTGDPGLSNRPLTLFNQVVNGGMGRWEVGDILETLRENVADTCRSWHYIDTLTTVNRIDDHEPNTIWGEDAKPLFTMLGRFMSRMFMKGAVGKANPVVAQVQVSLDPTFATGVTEVDTSVNGTTGWWFEHTDGGQSPFLPAGPSGTTVIGIVFDPSLAGVDYDLSTHHARWRKSIYGIWEDWKPAKFVDVEDRWYSMLQIEDQKSVNHFVLPNLINKGWLFTKKPKYPIGGATIFIRDTIGADDVVDVEIQIGDSIEWSRAEARSTKTSKVGWSLVRNEEFSEYPVNSTFPAALAGETHIVFDPVAAAITSRTGTRYYRYRLTKNGVVGVWKVRTTATTEATQLRVDMMTVLGFDSLRKADAPIPMIREAHNRMLVSNDKVMDVTDAEYNDDGYGIVPPEPVEGPVIVVGEGVSWTNNNIDQSWRHQQALMAGTRMDSDYPAFYEFPVWGIGKTTAALFSLWRGYPTYQPAPYTYFAMRFGSPNYWTHATYLPGSTRMHFARRHSSYLGLVNTYMRDGMNVNHQMQAAEDPRFVVWHSALNSSNYAVAAGTTAVMDLVLGYLHSPPQVTRYSGYASVQVLRDGLCLLPTSFGMEDLLVMDPNTGLIATVMPRKIARPLYSGFSRSGTFSPALYGRYGGERFMPIMGWRGIETWRYDDAARPGVEIDTMEGYDDAWKGLSFNALRWNPVTYISYGSNRFTANDAVAYNRLSFWDTLSLPMRNGYISPAVYENMLGTRIVGQQGQVAASGDWSGLFRKANGYYAYSAIVACPNLGIFHLCLNTSGNAVIDFVWYNAFDGRSKSHNIDRISYLPVGSNMGCGLGGFGHGLFARGTAASATMFGAGQTLQCLMVGDVFPGIAHMKGEQYARLAAGSHLGRRL